MSDGDRLDELTGRPIYADMYIGEINIKQEYMEPRYPGGEVFLRPGQAHGDVDPLAVQHKEKMGQVLAITLPICQFSLRGLNSI